MMAVYSDICRLCLGHGKLISIFDKDKSVQISSKIMSFAAVQVIYLNIILDLIML